MFLTIGLIVLLILINIGLQLFLRDYKKRLLFAEQKVVLFEIGLFNMLQNISLSYPNDGTSPGLVLSYLPKENLYYASIVRYLYPKGEGKRVVCNVRSDRENLISDICRIFDSEKDADVEKRYQAYENWKNKNNLQMAEKT